MTGLETLRVSLDEFSSALRAFDDPLSDELAGVRMMRDALREREQHLRRQIDELETCSLTLAVEGSRDDHALLTVPFVLALLGAVQDAVTATGAALLGEGTPGAADVEAALTLRLTVLDTDAGVVGLQRQPGHPETQLVDPSSGELLVERALAALVDALAAPEDDKPFDVLPGAAVAAVGGLGQLLATQPLRLRVSLDTFGGESRDVALTRAGAQALARRLE